MAGFPHLDIDEETRTIMADISVCRDEACAVPKKHPFYPTPDQPPFYYGRRPCMPVVPTNLATGKVMIIGEYPNCRFGTVQEQATGKLEKFVPVADISEPFEGGRYYDGYSIRDYPTQSSLQTYFLEPLGLHLREDVWLTNVIKCYLMRPPHINNYDEVGWDTPSVEASYDTDSDYFDIASVCMKRHLIKEVEKCQPKLIIALGEKAYRMLHATSDFTDPASDITMKNLVGRVFEANVQTDRDPLDKRDSFFLQYNVVHFYHPSYFVRGAPAAVVETHTTEHIVAVRAFLDTLNLS